jgi:hypothetical protein
MTARHVVACRAGRLGPTHTAGTVSIRYQLSWPMAPHWPYQAVQTVSGPGVSRQPRRRHSTAPQPATQSDSATLRVSRARTGRREPRPTRYSVNSSSAPCAVGLCNWRQFHCRVRIECLTEGMLGTVTKERRAVKVCRYCPLQCSRVELAGVPERVGPPSGVRTLRRHNK